MQNIVILAGNIGQAPEARVTQGGTKITHFTLATSRPRLSEGRPIRDEHGYRVMDTEWHRITCFNGLGKSVAENCEKGMKVLVQGRIHYTKWTDVLSDNHHGRLRQPPWPVGLNGRRACPSGGQSHRPHSFSG
jgi:single-strand DNA-binding protein